MEICVKTISKILPQSRIGQVPQRWLRFPPLASSNLFFHCNQMGDADIRLLVQCHRGDIGERKKDAEGMQTKKENMNWLIKKFFTQRKKGLYKPI
jgi:hypothetical protein